LTKSLLITVTCLFLTACGAKGDLYIPTEKPVEQQQSADPEEKLEQQSKQSNP